MRWMVYGVIFPYANDETIPELGLTAGDTRVSPAVYIVMSDAILATGNAMLTSAEVKMSNISIDIAEITGKLSSYTPIARKINYSSLPSGTFLVSGTMPSIVIDITNTSFSSNCAKYNAQYQVEFLYDTLESYTRHGGYGTIPNEGVSVNSRESYTLTMQEFRFSFVPTNSITMEIRFNGRNELLSYIFPSFSIELIAYYID